MKQGGLGGRSPPQRISREMQHFPKAHLCTDRLSGGRLGAGRLSGGRPRNLRSGRLGRILRSGRFVVVFTVASGVVVSVEVVSVVHVSVVVVSMVVVTVSRGLMTKSCVPVFYLVPAAKLHGTEGFSGASACDSGPSCGHPGAA